MKDNVVSSAVRRFIEREIHSVEQLEILLLLYRGGERDWSAEQVSQELRTSPTSAGKRLQDLERRNIVTASPGGEGRYRIDSSHPPERRILLAELDTCYRTYRIRIVELIFSRSNGALDAFLDAFQIGKEEK